MKDKGQQTANRNTHFNANKKRAENKDNLDSREGLEQELKGDDSTHNVKEQKSRKKSEDRKDEKGKH